MSLFAELQRRNVVRVAIAYAVVAWLLAQVADIAFDNFGAPDWVPKSVLFVLILGFPLAVFFAWAFELTPEGVKREKDVDRSQSITNVTGRKLNRLIIAVLVLAVGFLLVDKFVLQPVPEEVIADAPVADVDKSVAVLPFVAMSSGPDDEFFADGLTEEILNSLAQLPDLLVTARTSAFAFKGIDVSIPEIAAQLGVANVVEGSVRRSGDRLRVTAQLIRAEDGFHLWSETYERSTADSFGVQDEIAEKVASALDVVLDDEQLRRMRSTGLQNPEAFIAFQKGMKLHSEAHAMGLEEMSRGLLLANEEFTKTIELEPGASHAHFVRSDYYVHFVIDRVHDERVSAEEILDALETAKAGLRRAMETATNEAERFNVSLEYTLIAEEWRRMAELYAAALESVECLEPSWWAAIGPLLTDLDKTIAMWRRSAGCDPLDFYNWSNLTALEIQNGEIANAIKTATRALQTVPHRQIADQLVAAYLAAGQFEEALAASERHIENVQGRRFNQMAIMAARGEGEEARSLLDELLAVYGDQAVVPAHYAIIGDRERANQIAAEIDARPLGFLILVDLAGGCRCGAPFDLEVTPNFARFVEEADLMWPPRSPTEWPLKTW
jgi:TolB-like protein/tetratricopeptide (TPR) repeat protein